MVKYNAFPIPKLQLDSSAVFFDLHATRGPGLVTSLVLTKKVRFLSWEVMMKGGIGINLLLGEDGVWGGAAGKLIQLDIHT